jgi:hypothetical protein
MRVSATTLQSFRLFMEPEQEWMTEAALIETIKGEFTGNVKTDRGAAFGRAITEPDRWPVETWPDPLDEMSYFQMMAVPVDDKDDAPVIYLPADMVRECARHVPPDLTYEVKVVKDYDGIDVVSKVDGVKGISVWEFKMTDGFDIDKYLSSCQPKFYLDAFDADKVTFIVFDIRERKSRKKALAGVSRLELVDVHPFDVYPYPRLHEDCVQIVRDFVDYVDRRGLRQLAENRPVYR